MFLRASSCVLVALLSTSIACSSKAKEEKKKETTADTPEKPEEKPAGGDGPLRVAGASDLVFVMEEVVKRFEAANPGAKVDFVPGSSGKLAAQLTAGAPFDVFMSANVKFVDDVVSAGACDGATKALYARGRVVMWAREGGKPPPDKLEGLADKQYATISMAQPEHAPYGAAAKAALEKVGKWKDVEKRVVYGSNIKETMQMAETGNAEIGLIALSLAIKSKGKYTEIPADLHSPIDQGLAVCNNGKRKDLGLKFAEFMKSKETVDLMTSYGLPPAQ